MPEYGLLDEGFVVKPVSVIRSEMIDKVHTDVDPGFDLSDESPWGQLIGIAASHIGEVWEVIGAVYDARDPDNATKKSLDNVCAITGTKRNAPQKSFVLATVNVDPGTYAPGDLVAHVDGDPTARFVNVDQVVNAEVSAEEAVGVKFEAESTGPIRANSGTLTVIAEAFTGWNSITNPLDAEIGDNGEEDADLRIRRRNELAAAGGATFEAVRSDLLKLISDAGFNGQVLILFNDTDDTDGDGLLPHSFEAIVYDGSSGGTNLTDEQIAEQIWKSKPLGIRTHGTTTQNIVDSQGVTRAIKFTRPTLVTVWFEFDVKADPDLWNGVESETFSKNVVVDFGETLLQGQDVIVRRFEAELLKGVAGLWDITATRVGTIASPVGTTNLSITTRQLATFDTSRVEVNVTLQTPS